MYDILEGVRVVEVAMYAFVPSAGAVLADWGADVVKVGHPAYADPMRSGTILGDLPKKDVGVTFMWEIMNRGKRCIGVDLATDDGYEILRRMVSDADVFITSFLPTARTRLRIDVADIRAMNPDIIYGRGSGQGSRGPQHDAPGFDHTSYWARSGLAHAASMVTGEFIQQPGPSLGDLQSGFALASGVVGALLKRERTGQPSVVDVSLLSTGVWSFSPSIMAADLFDVDTIPRVRHEDVPNPMVAAYRTRDGRQIYLSGMRLDKGWPEFCELIGRPDLAKDPRFADGGTRLENRKACIEELDRVFAERTLAEWQELLSQLDVAWATIQTAREVNSDPQVVANGYIASVEHPSGGTFGLPASPVQFDETPLTTTRAPEHAEHTEMVLLDLGFDWDQISALKERGVVS